MRVLTERLMNVMHATGYACDRIELGASDFNHIVRLYETDPVYFRAWLYQMQGRFTDNRANTPAKAKRK